MNVEYSKRAVEDLREIASYYQAAAGPGVAQAVAEGIRETVARIARHPESGRQVAQHRGVRVAPLLRYRYRIFYRVTGGTIRILHIRHMSRRPWRRR